MCNKQAFFSNRIPRHHGFTDHPFHRFGKKYEDHSHGGAVNVEEFDDKYVLHVSAPGFSKTDFVVNIKDETLIIKAAKDVKENSESRWRRREFDSGGVERYFQLNEKMDKNGISASYQDGVLQIFLPKLEGYETVRHKVEVE